MKKLKELLKIVETDGIYMKDAGKTKPTCYKVNPHELSKVVSACRPFVFEPHNSIPDDSFVHDYPHETNIDAPFPVFSIEFSGDTNITVNDPGSFYNNIPCVLVHEVNPKEYLIWAQINMGGKSTVLTVDNTWGSMAPLIQSILDRLKTGRVGVEEVNGVVRMKKPGNPKKKISVPKPFVYVVAQTKRYKETYADRNIDWSHRWEVRGHWRKTSGIGKDRDGNYCVEGFTWVRPSVKGPDNKPLVSKQRVVPSVNHPND